MTQCPAPERSSQVAIHLTIGASRSLAGWLAALAWLWIAYIHVLRVPFLGHGHAIARAGASGALFGLFLSAALKSSGAPHPVSTLVIASAALAVAAGALAGLRLWRAGRVIAKFAAIRDLTNTQRRLHRFTDQEEPDVSAASRVTKSAVYIGHLQDTFSPVRPSAVAAAGATRAWLPGPA